MILSEYLYSVGKGFTLGGSLCIISFYMDTTVSYKSYKKMKKYKRHLYIESLLMNQVNLLIVSPVMYGAVDTMLLTHTHEFQWFNIYAILVIHCISYYYAHYAMHKVRWLYKYHQFHHKFDNLVLPSVGNAVSVVEFCFAYTLPFIISAYILKPNETSFLVPIGVIGLLNMVVHTPEFETVPWVKWLVSPRNHIQHHKKRNCHYASPTLNIDYILGEN